jgi:hypothetical protein
MPFLPAVLSVTAKTMATCAYLPVVMNCLTPLNTKWSPSRVGTGGDRRGIGAGVRLGQAEAAEHVATGQRLQVFSFCASLPYFMVMPQASEFCTLTMVEVAPSPAAISSSISTSDM